MTDDTPAGQPEGDPFDYAEDGEYRGNVNALELDEGEEERRAAMLAAAIRYAGLGFRTIPLNWLVATGKCSCPKGDACPSPGKHPYFGGWQKPPTTPAEEDRRWWRELAANEGNPVDWLPKANIGILTGEVSGIFVLDIDCKEHDGFQTLAQAEARHPDEPMPATLIVQTGSGGRHYFFRHPGFRITNAKPWGEKSGIDIRGDAGQVVAVPSLSGYGAYTVAANITSADQIPEAPSWILEQITEKLRQHRGEPSALSGPPAPDGRRRRYGAAALAGEKKKLAECAGGRNIQLNNSALALGSLSEECSISYEEAYDALRQACEINGLIRDDGLDQCTASFRSGWGTGLRSPRHPDYRDFDDADGELPAITPRPWTQYGNGERLVDAFGDQLGWNMDRERWMAERNGVWRNGDNKTGFRFARRMIDSLASSEALCYPDDDGDPEAEDGDKRSTREKFLDKVRGWMCRSETSAAAEFGLTHDVMCCRDSDFDTDPDQLNAPNGVINLRTSDLIPHAEVTGRFTMQVAAPYSKDAQCPRFMRFLEQAQPDPEIRRWLQARTGYAAFGDASEQVAFFDYGAGGCGKSVFSDANVATLGSYAQGVFVETLTRARKDGTVPTDIASMAGKRYLVASETRPGQSLDEQAFKQLTGDRTVRARKMRQDFSDFLRTWTIALIANDPVHVSDDSATWRRIWVTKWENPVDEASKDKHLLDTIIEQESAGVLRWIVEGARIWAEEGLVVPDKVKAWTAEYREEENYLAAFVEECCVETEPVRHRDSTVGQRLPGVIHDAYRLWAKNAGAPELGQRALCRKLVAQGFERADSGAKHFKTLMVKYLGE